MSLSRCGINKMTLVDKDILLPENTPRHLCGLIEASNNMKKVDAVKEKILGYFPYIKLDVYQEDILVLLEKDNNILNNVDIVIVAVGNRGVERRLNYLQINSLIKKPIVYSWIEPLGVGGHVLYVHPNNISNAGCYNCLFNENGDFIYSISDTSNHFHKREGGCQSTFMPYSALMAEQFAIIISKMIIKLLNDFPITSKLFTWVAGIEDFEKSGHKLNDNYASRLSSEIIERDIIKRGTCTICGKVKNIM